jgi:hypothetical protein
VNVQLCLFAQWTNERTHAHAQLRNWTERMNFSSSTLEYINDWINQSRSDVRTIDRCWSSYFNSQWHLDIFDLIHWKETFLSLIVRGSDERRGRLSSQGGFSLSFAEGLSLVQRTSSRCSVLFVDRLKHPLPSQQTSFDMFNDRYNLRSICPSMNWKQYKSNEGSMWHVEHKVKRLRQQDDRWSVDRPNVIDAWNDQRLCRWSPRVRWIDFLLSACFMQHWWLLRSCNWQPLLRNTLESGLQNRDSHKIVSKSGSWRGLGSSLLQRPSATMLYSFFQLYRVKEKKN